MQTGAVAEHARPKTGNAIVVRDVVKSYGGVPAVDGLSFAVERGEIFALLGPNGAGKTTTVEMLEGYRQPDAGTVRVLDYDPISQGREMKQHMGLMLQQTTLYEKIRVREAVDLFTSYYENSRDPEDLISLAGLESHRNNYFDNLSGGQKQRLSLALALAGNPQVVFLDEPTAGMDPQARLQTWEIVNGLRDDGVTILLTTHYMEEAQRLADHIAIMDHGKLIAFGTPDELTNSTGSEVISFTSQKGLNLDGLRKLPFVVGVREARPGGYSMTTSNALESVAALASWRRDAGVVIDHLQVSQGTLEEVFLRLTGEEVRD
jgi:ABC-2 type transport system ATP-binding protein